MNRLEGKTALVTGGSTDRGRAVARALGRAGASVLLQYDACVHETNKVVSELKEIAGRAGKLQADLGSSHGARILAEGVRSIIGGRLDILVLNASSDRSISFETSTPNQFDEAFATNVHGPVVLLDSLRPILCQGSNIVICSSALAGATADDPHLAAATEGALAALVTELASMLGERGIRINGLANATAETIGEATVFLASDGARWVTGTTVRMANSTLM